MSHDCQYIEFLKKKYSSVFNRNIYLTYYLNFWITLLDLGVLNGVELVAAKKKTTICILYIVISVHAFYNALMFQDIDVAK